MTFQPENSIVDSSTGDSLFGLNADQLAALMERFGQKRYRAVQLHDALYRRRVETLDQISVFPASLRQELHVAGYRVGQPEIAQTARSIDGTERYLVRLADGETVEDRVDAGWRRWRARRRLRLPR